MPRVLKIAIHVLLFVVAIIVFYLGLGVGLIMNPTAGTILWAVAAAIGVGNLLWILWPRLSQPKT